MTASGRTQTRFRCCVVEYFLVPPLLLRGCAGVKGAEDIGTVLQCLPSEEEKGVLQVRLCIK